MNQKGFTPIAIILIILGILVLGGGSYYAVKKFQKPVVQVCTQEAKVCPDGSTVSRTGPNCEFVQCPTIQDQTAGWKTYTNTQYGFEIKYPSNYQVQNPDANFMRYANQIEVAKLSGSPDNIEVIYVNNFYLDLSTGKYGTDKIWFDNSSNQWMRTQSVETREGGDIDTTEKINPSYNNSGLIIFDNMRGVLSEEAVALSHDKFVIISAGDSGPIRDIIKSIASTIKLTK